ncbi:MAG: hypothetical protein J0L99_11270 [Chitinophagales bacterium]|nr:hypothetical protein [Chitinophagales bacterium]
MKISYLLIILCLFGIQAQAQQCPNVLQCPTDTTILCYTNANMEGLWQNMHFYDALRERDDLAEAGVSVTLRLLDTCGAFSANATPACHLFFDLNGDNLVESYVYTDSAQTPGTLRSTVGGSEQELVYDQRTLPDSLKYLFALDTIWQGDTLEIRLRMRNALENIPAFLPDAGVFEAIWLLEGDTLCHRRYRLRDCQAPEITCLSVVPGVIYETFFGQGTVWPSDAILSVTDNATDIANLQLGLIRKSESNGVFPEPTPPYNLSVITVNCGDELMPPLSAELWARDAAGNAAFCPLLIVVLDPGEICGEVPPTLQICTKSELDKPVAGVRVDIDFVSPFLPSTSFEMSDTTGCVWKKIASNLFITPYVRFKPQHRYNYVQGVSSFDLLLISKHILGIEALNSPYKIIAADANRSGSITTLDIMELRRLVLGIDTLLPNNDSWRFVPRSYVFPNPSNPFIQPIPDSLRFDWNPFVVDYNFVAVKIGDINLNALPLQNNHSEDRTLYDSLSLMMPRAQSGELVPIYFEKARLEGFQWSLQNVEPELIVPGPGLAEEHFAWSAEQRTLRCSWISPDASAQDFDASRPICWLKLKQAPLRLENGFASEAYEAGAVQRVIRLESAPTQVGKPEAVVVAPNPTSGSAWVQGRLAQAGAWNFQVLDAQGKLLWTGKGFAENGAFELQIPALAMPVAGICFWIFNTADTVQTGTLIKH